MSWTFSGQLAPVGPDGKPSIRALGMDDLNVVFQPIVSLSNGSVFAHEALVRCKIKSLGNPALLFTEAVEQRACGHLGRVIRKVAFERCADASLFVNIHPDELTSRWLVRPDDAMGFHGHEVFLEITETAAFTHFDLCMSVLKEVCNRTGAHLVVDDFGAGHSNIQRVLDLRPAVVKLDGALIRGLDQDKRRQKLVSHIIKLCADLGARIVAECVETVDELKAVRDTGAHFVQGYLLAKPSYPIPDITWPLRSSRRPVPVKPIRDDPAPRSKPPRKSSSPKSRRATPSRGGPRHSDLPRLKSMVPKKGGKKSPSRRMKKR